MLPSARKPFFGSAWKSSTMCHGLMASSTLGYWTIWLRPSTPRVVNQTTMTGPNTRPTASVPRLCTANRPTRMTHATGITQSSKAGDATLNPSTALSTEMAGVMRPSP